MPSCEQKRNPHAECEFHGGSIDLSMVRLSPPPPSPSLLHQRRYRLYRFHRVNQNHGFCHRATIIAVPPYYRRATAVLPPLCCTIMSPSSSYCKIYPREKHPRVRRSTYRGVREGGRDLELGYNRGVFQLCRLFYYEASLHNKI